MTTTSAPPAPKPRRRWLQFSLRTLLVLMLVLGCGLGWLAYKIKAAREQRAAVDAIHKMGGGCVLCNYWFDSRRRVTYASF
jgi:hypothetical protein